MTKASIQEGGCTTPPRIPPDLLGTPAVLPCLAAISPVALAGLLWMAAGGAGTGGGVGGLSRVMAVSVFLWATALGISVLAVVRSKDRVERALGLVGLVGNVLLLVVGLFWRTWGRNA